MGTSLLYFYKNKIKPQWKFAFGSTFLIALLIHFYKFSNTLLNHDSLFNFYSDQNMVGSGRWFLSIACGISSYFDLPWVIGLLSVIYIALTVVVIIELFQVKNPIVILLIGGLTAAFPGITETFYFEFTADGYMLAMLLAALAVYHSNFEHTGWKTTILPIVFICLSCGIYQAYVSFALLLTLFYFVNELLENRRTSQEYRKYILRQILIYAVGMILYYVIWKICMAVQGAGATSYQGIDEVSNLAGISFSPTWFIRGVLNCIKTLYFFFMEWNVFGHGLTLYAALNILFIAVFFAALLIAAYKSGLLRRRIHLLLAVLSLALCVPCAGMWHFASEDVGYRPMMLQSLSLLYIYGAILFDHWFKSKFSNIAGILLAIIIFNNTIVANIGYYYMDKAYEQSYATGLEMTMRIHDLEGEYDFDKIAVVGERMKEVSTEVSSEEAQHIHMMSQLLETDLLYDRIHVQLFLENIFHINNSFATVAECEALEAQSVILEMETWPSTDSMQVINGILVIKIGDIDDGEVD